MRRVCEARRSEARAEKKRKRTELRRGVRYDTRDDRVLAACCTTNVGGIGEGRTKPTQVVNSTTGDNE